MSTLPHEVLLIIIRHLKRDELLQCQLTCKQWYKASLRALYTSVDINSEEEAVLYAYTISESPALGECLKNIHFHNLFDQKRERISSENHSILDTIIKHCPNITRMGNTDNKGFPFWTQLMQAAKQGQLSNLKSLPRSCSKDLRSYISTVLLFKNSLEQLSLCDNRFLYGPQLAKLEMYQRLCGQIDQFKSLQSLSFFFQSDRQLSYFDGLIDKCQYLKELRLDLIIRDRLPPSEAKPTIHSRPGIHTFICRWELLGADSQLEYVMLKFPVLRKLVVTPGLRLNVDDLQNLSDLILIKFIQYALTIRDFSITINTNHENLLIIWAEVMKTKYGLKSLGISYYKADRWNIIDLSSESTMSILFPLNADDSYSGIEPPHIQFFSEAGRTIRSLVVNRSGGIPSINGRISTTMEWLFDILLLCPFMEEIKIIEPSHLSPFLHTLKYPSVKKLAIRLVGDSSSTNFLDCLSFCLPNLHQLSFQFSCTKPDYTEPIEVFMPHTSLDLLTWSETGYNPDIEIYIRLKTDVGTKFYLAIQNTVFPIDSKCYDVNTNNIRFDISCNRLKELRIRRDCSPESVSNLFF